MLKAIAITLALAFTAKALEVPAKVAEREVVVRDHVEVKHHPDAWVLVIPRDFNSQLTKNEAVSPGVWHFWGPPGLYQVFELRRDTGEQKAAQCQIVEGFSPDPGPGPNPPPTPPGPGPVLPRGVMILYETQDGGPAMDKVNLEVRRVLGNQFADRWRLWDPDMAGMDLQYANPDMVAIFEYAKREAAGRYPWIVISTGQNVQSLPLPGTAAELLQLLPTTSRRAAYCVDGKCYDQWGNAW